MLCEKCIAAIAANKLDKLDVAFMKVLSSLGAKGLINSRTLKEITEELLAQNKNSSIKVTTALVNKTIFTLQLFDFISTSTGKPQKYYLSEYGQQALDFLIVKE